MSEEKIGVPADVLWVWLLPELVGKEIYDKAQNIIADNPKHFPWEHKYKSIPAEVHEAYNAETKKEWTFEASDGMGILPSILERGSTIDYDPNEGKSIVEMFTELDTAHREDHRRRIAEWEKEKKVWDKHYKKYGLAFKKEYPSAYI